jgi:hypothetical protein
VYEREKIMLMWMVREVLRGKELYTYSLDDMFLIRSVCVFGIQCVIASPLHMASEEDAVLRCVV